MTLARGQHRGHNDGACMDRAPLERIVEVLAMGRGPVDQGGAGGAQRAGMADRSARAVIVAGCKHAFYIIEAPRREAKPHHVDCQIFALGPHRGRKARRVDGGDAFGEALRNRD